MIIMNDLKQKSRKSNSLRIIIILLISFLLTYLVSIFLPSSLPLFLPEGKRPGIVKNMENKINYIDARLAADEIARGNGILVDVRDTEEFMVLHSEGAINIPYHSESEDIYAELDVILPEGKKIYILCEGKLCEMSVRVAGRLEESGYQSNIIRQDFDGWKRLKLPTEKVND